ncbi:uncharacterized protein NECHADRAFT_47938 [Fusarium vanettenii 77-13-4]|uniref:Transaldolase n=1 Tax=Fusarium vanettenii (strain ATCC MYA-4622 / CBS 123669 / FGSC 9596 / NRRL 45880 / 77-13-4) TaxID=660122 RepID=C7ZD73_FUSV7|nr:uncharacterized protein NECHADRAFT_47938 [Fusarium vanettenii 77-13-4]EEU38041.1 hypothetical protein NECHADRAFT_47938 [Fusarium vanettenii 77-13-4]
MPTLLDALRQTSQVDCDTLDSDGTDWPKAIAFFEVSRPLAGQSLLHHESLIADAIRDARAALKGLQGATTFEEFVVEILTNPKLSYSTAGTIDNAHRIIDIFKALAPDFDTKRVCIKIPSTWEGLQACRSLEMKGIATLATTMFCMEQAALAAEAQCTYIAPYVNELKVHFEEGYVDQNKAFDFCREAQAYYISHSFRTQVLAASLTSVDEVMQLAGIQNVTISPSLLRGLASTDLSSWNGKLGEYFAQGPANKSWETRDYGALVKNESAWRLAFTRSGFGSSEGKIIQAINYFADFQEKLEELMADIPVSAAFGTGEPTPHVSPENAAKRVNPIITPQDRDWRRMHHTFTELHKSDSTLQKILSDHFTYHEAHMLLASDRADIKSLQDANTERYNTLLQGRFRGVKRDLVSKLTMIYFGLPVEPLTSPLEELVNEFGLNQPHVPMYNVQPPLHFLSAHQARNWGKDSLRGKSMSLLPVQQTTSVPQEEPVMGLRGGDDDYHDESDGDDGDDAMGYISPDDEVPDTSTIQSDYWPQFEPTALPKDEWIYLYGYNGCVPFVPRKWRSYAKALRQILRLDHLSPVSGPKTPYDPSDYIPEDPIEYILVHFNRKTNKATTIDDELYLTEDSPAMKYLLEHFTGDTTTDHEDCCAFFATYAEERPPHPRHWEPHPEQFETDLVKIGHHVFDAKSGPGKNAISYAYIAFPKTKTATFTIDKFGCNQFNANFRMAMDVVLGKSRSLTSEHGLLRLVDRNKPDTEILPPIVFNSMGQMQWVWEILHPLNNPGADWMVDWMGMGKGTHSMTAVVVPNYYPDPHPHLLSNEVWAGVTPFKDAFKVIQDAVTEAFNEETIARMDSIIVMGRLENIEIPTNRPYLLEERLQFAKDVYGVTGECLSILPVWRAGESKMFPAWPTTSDVYTDFPPLNSRLGTLFKLIDTLCSATNRRRDWRRAKDVILLKSLPPWDALATPKTESPAFLLTTETSENEWLAIRSAITSCDVSVSFLKASEADWWRSIAKSNIWGVRPEFSDDSERSWFWYRHAWTDFNASMIKKVDGSKSLPIPRQLKNEAKAAAEELPFAKKSKVGVDGLKGTVKAKAKGRKSAFTSRRHFGPSPIFDRPKSPYISPGNRRPVFIESEEEETTQGPEDPLQEEPTDGLDQERLPPDADLWGEDDEPMEDVAEDAEKDAEEDAEEESEPSGQEARRPGVEFVTDSEYGDDVASVSSGPSDAPVTFSERTSRFKPMEPMDKDDRARTWAEQPGIFEGWDPKAWPSCNDIDIPITAAPIEKVFRTSDNVPMMTKAVLTPSEQAELQNSFFGVRNIALKRAMQCPFQGCDFSHRLDEPEAIEQHAKLFHQAKKCMWCDEPLFEWWSPEQRMAHLRKNHQAKLIRALGMTQPAGDKTKPFQSSFGSGSRWPTGTRKRQPPRQLIYPLPWYDYPGPLVHDDPPMTCPIPDCFANNFEYLQSRQIWDHFAKKHPEGTLDRCPLCHLPFVYTAEDKETGKKVKQHHPEDECIKHFDCHIWELWDSLMPKGKYATYDFVTDLPPPGPYGDLEGDEEMMARGAARSQAKDAARQKGGKGALLPQEEHQADTAEEEQAADTSKKDPRCPFFEKCGAIVGSMTDEQFRRHIRVSHPKEVQMVDFDSEDGEATEEEAPAPRTRTPAPTPRPAIQPEVTEVTEAEDAQTDESNRPSSETVQSRTSTSKKRKRNVKPRNQAMSQGSEDELSGLASDTPSRPSRTRTREKLVPIELQPLEETDVYAPAASESRSSATQGRDRPPKKARRERQPRDDDGEYEDDAHSTDDEPEEQPEAPKRPRRARSPDWIRKLGPGDPNFEPSDDMYCSKCLRKAPKSGNKSPSRSPLGREKELECHSDVNRCCRIRNGEGSSENLPNRSGWIRASDLPAKLGQIKSQFTSKYPAYDRTIYPTKPSDNNASVWRSDPNNDDNEPFWNMPWPPYEGQPPFPGSWEDPGIPVEERGRKKRRDSWQGRQEDDPLYRYQSDEDTDDDLKPDVDDIAELQEEASNDNIDTGIEEDDGPATKKAKKTPGSKFLSKSCMSSHVLTSRLAKPKPKPKAKRAKKPRGKAASSQPSRASSRVRQKKTGGAKSKGQASQGVSEDASGVGE